jgi:glutamine transport system permease protein
MVINTNLVYQAFPYLLKGALVSVEITVISYALGFVLGVIVGYLHTLKSKALRIPITAYVTLIRGTPMLIQIAFFYYVLPLVGIALSPFFAATLAIAINSSAYMSQIIKSGIIGVGHEQIEAARVLGFSSFQIGRYIVIPQAIRIVFPALVGEYITLLKDSSLASTIGVMELYKEARSIMSQTYDVITIFCLVAIFYLVLTSVSELLFRIIERKMNWYVKH